MDLTPVEIIAIAMAPITLYLIHISWTLGTIRWLLYRVLIEQERQTALMKGEGKV